MGNRMPPALALMGALAELGCWESPGHRWGNALKKPAYAQAWGL